MSLISCIQDQGPYYRKLSKDLESENRVIRELTIARTERDRLAREVDIKQDQVIKLEKQSKKEFESVRKLRHLSFRSAAATLSGKKKELTAKEEAGYQYAFENEQRAKRELEGLQAQYNSVIIKERELEQQKARFSESRAQYNALLEQIFESEDPGFPVEAQLRKDLKSYYEQKGLASRDKQRFMNASDSLEKTSIGIRKVIQLLDRVVNFVPFDIFGGSLIDEEQIVGIEAAKKKIWEIQGHLNAARTYLPEIPYPHTLDIVTNNPMMNMPLNWNYVDMTWKVKTTQCIAILAAATQNVKSSMNWIEQYKTYAEGAIERLKAAIENTKFSLEEERRRIIEAVLSGQLNGLNSSGGNSSSDPSPPPPVYEAPPPARNSLDQNGNQSNSLPTIPSNISLSSPTIESTTPLYSPVNGTAMSPGTSQVSSSESSNYLQAPSPSPARTNPFRDNILAPTSIQQHQVTGNTKYNPNNPFNS
ncbi:hypothetical protein RMATCC62417_16005 [Rhizopus microsporus]|nr:hypothetical protein RMATCC62417_16005 [Rhizopus microsporus]